MKQFVATVASLAFCVCLLLSFSGCKKKTPPLARPTQMETSPLPGPVTPRPSKPTAEINATPSTIQRSQQSTLHWKSTDAASLAIDPGVGNVAESGSVIISPHESTTYTVTAVGAGGEARASTRVTVLDRKEPASIIGSEDIATLESALRQGKIRPVLFGYDMAELTSQARRILAENARWFRQFPRVRITIEGHCDERGTEEYNLALGDLRARVVLEYLVSLGVTPGQAETISFGEERPFTPGHDEKSWEQNRRAHFVVQQ